MYRADFFYTYNLFIFTPQLLTAQEDIMKTLNPGKLLPLGTIGKSHGFKGEFSLILENPELTDPEKLKASFIFLVLEGLPVPFFVEDVREKSGVVILKIETVDSESQARKLNGIKVKMEMQRTMAGVSVREEQEWTGLRGYLVHDASYGELGPILEVQEYPMQYIAKCMVDGKEVLFPLHEEMILDIDDEGRRIETELPDGLLDVYLKS
jgi:16S rRNA processing protein RimM